MSASVPTAHTIGAAIRHHTTRQIAACGACGVEIETPMGAVLIVTPTEKPLCADYGTEFAPALQTIDALRGARGGRA
jgi:hypothetical protein